MKNTSLADKALLYVLQITRISFQTYREFVRILSGISREDVLQDMQSFIVATLAGEELGALVKQLQQAGCDGTGEWHHQRQETPGPVRDAQEVDAVSELQGKDGEGEH